MGSVAVPLGLASAVVHAERSNEALLDASELMRLGAQLVEACRAAGCTVLVAASKSAIALVTASVLIGDGSVSVGRVLAGQRVMIVDGAIVTGASVRAAVASTRESGASWLGVTVLQRTRPDLDELDQLGRVTELLL